MRSRGNRRVFSMIRVDNPHHLRASNPDHENRAAQLPRAIRRNRHGTSLRYALAAGNCKVAKIPCNWDMANWGGGWSFAPDYLPTGEELFQSGAVANSGGYADAQNDSLIAKTLTSSNLQDMYTWQDYLAPKLPMMWQPNGAYSLTEIASNLKGATPQSPTLSINPENWYFTK